MSKVYYISEGIFTEEEIKNESRPLVAIKNYCKYNCCCGEKDSWKNCNVETCFLWNFRNGKNPMKKKNLTEEQRKDIGDRLKKCRIKNNADKSL